MKNDTYWVKRAERRIYEYQKQADEVADDIAEAYIQSTNYINGEIEKIFRTFRLDSGISEAEARRLLNSLPDNNLLQNLRQAVKHIKDPDKRKELLTIINSPAYAHRIKRFEQLQASMDTETAKLADFEQSITKAHYVDLAEEAYSRAMFDIQQGLGLGFPFAKMPTSRINEILRNNWSGKLFSERIWGNTADLNRRIKLELLTQFMTGRAYYKTAAAIQQQMAVGAMEARRLVRTESTYIANMAELESYKECEIEQLRFVATLDMRTSEICQSMDGRIIHVDDVVPGVNYPPLHPWCRSTTIAVIDGADAERLERWARDPKTGKTYKVPADMTYAEWKKAIDEKCGAGTYTTERKKVTRKASDKAQYERYKAILGGGNLPGSFDRFQDLKYNNSKGWIELKSDYRYKIMLNDRKIYVISDTVRSLPLEGPANSISDLVHPDGTVKQRRLYGPIRKPHKDFDTTDHNRPKHHPMGAHKHGFDYSKDNPHGKAEYLTERELRQNVDIIQEGVNYHDDRQKETD